MNQNMNNLQQTGLNQFGQNAQILSQNSQNQQNLMGQNQIFGQNQTNNQQNANQSSAFQNQSTPSFNQSNNNGGNFNNIFQNSQQNNNQNKGNNFSLQGTNQFALNTNQDQNKNTTNNQSSLNLFGNQNNQQTNQLQINQNPLICKQNQNSENKPNIFQNNINQNQDQQKNNNNLFGQNTQNQSNIFQSNQNQQPGQQNKQQQADQPQNQSNQINQQQNVQKDNIQQNQSNQIFSLSNQQGQNDQQNSQKLTVQQGVNEQGNQSLNQNSQQQNQQGALLQKQENQQQQPQKVNLIFGVQDKTQTIGSKEQEKPVNLNPPSQEIKIQPSNTLFSNKNQQPAETKQENSLFSNFSIPKQDMNIDQIKQNTNIFGNQNKTDQVQTPNLFNKTATGQNTSTQENLGSTNLFQQNLSQNANNSLNVQNPAPIQNTNIFGQSNATEEKKDDELINKKQKPAQINIESGVKNDPVLTFGVQNQQGNPTNQLFANNQNNQQKQQTGVLGSQNKENDNQSKKQDNDQIVFMTKVQIPEQLNQKSSDNKPLYSQQQSGNIKQDNNISKQNPTSDAQLLNKLKLPQRVEQQKEQLLQQCDQSQINLYTQIQTSELISLLLLKQGSIQEKVLNMTRMLEYDDSAAKVFDTFQSQQNQEEIRALMKQSSQQLNIHPSFVLKFTNKNLLDILKIQDKDEMKQRFTQGLQLDVNCERLCSIKITNYYLQQCLQNNDEQYIVRQFFINKKLANKIQKILQDNHNRDEQLLLLKCLQLSVKICQLNESDIISVIQDVIKIMELRNNYNEEDIIKLRESQNKKQNIKDICLLILLQCMNIELVSDFIQDIYRDDPKIIYNYFKHVVKGIDSKFRNIPETKPVEELIKIIVNLFKKDLHDAYQAVEAENAQLRQETLGYMIGLVHRPVFQQDKNIYSQLIYSYLTILVHFQNLNNINNYMLENLVKLYSYILKSSDSIKDKFWGFNIEQKKDGLGKLFYHLAETSNQKTSLLLFKILKNALNSKFTGQCVQFFIENQISEQIVLSEYLWQYFLKNWVDFIDILKKPQQSLSFKLDSPVLCQIELVCKILIEQPLYLYDLEYYMLNNQVQQCDGYVTTFLLMDTFFYCQKLKNQSFKQFQMIIDAFKSLFKIQKIRNVVSQVLSMYPMVNQLQTVVHPFFELLNQNKSESLQDEKFQMILLKYIEFFSVIVEQSQYLLDDFPDEIQFRNNKKADKTYYDYQQIQQIIAQFSSSQQYEQTSSQINLFAFRLGEQFKNIEGSYYSTFLSDYLAFVYNYILAKFFEGIFASFINYGIGAEIFNITKLLLQKFSINVERIPLLRQQQENYFLSNYQFLLGICTNYLNNQYLQEFLLLSVDLDIVNTSQIQAFENKTYKTYLNMIEIDSNLNHPLLLPNIYQFIQNGLECIYQVVNLIDVYIENEVQKINLKYLTQLQIVSSFGQILCFKDKMYFYHHFFKSETNIHEVKISLILCIISHIKYNQQNQVFQLDRNLLKNITASNNSKGLYQNDSISVNALKLLTKIMSLWLQLPIQKQPQFVDYFQEVLESSNKMSIINTIQIQLMTNLEDFLSDTYNTIATLEFLTVCMQQQLSFLNLFWKLSSLSNSFNKSLSDRLTHFLQKAVQFCASSNEDIFLILLNKLISFIFEASKNQFLFVQQFMKSNYFTLLIETVFEKMIPSVFYDQINQEDPINNQFYSQSIQVQILEYQQKLSFEIQNRFAVAQLSQLITQQFLQKNSQVTNAISTILDLNYKKYVEYFCSYGEKDSLTSQKQKYLQQLYLTITEVNPNINLQIEYKLEREVQKLTNLIFKNLDSNLYGFGRNYLIDSQELFFLLKSLQFDNRLIENQILNCQKQNLTFSLLEVDQHCFREIRQFYLILCTIGNDEGNIYSALQPDYNQVQNVLKQNIYLLNSNDDIKLGTSFERIFNNKESALQFVFELIQIISKKFIVESYKFQDSFYLKQYYNALEMLTYSFQSVLNITSKLQKKMERQLFQEDIINSTLVYINSGMQAELDFDIQDGKIIVFLQLFLKYLSTLENIYFKDYPLIFNILLEIQKYLIQNDSSTIGVLNSLLYLIKIDGVEFMKNTSKKIMIILTDKMQFGKVNEQDIILKIFNEAVNLESENQGVKIIKNLNVFQSTISCNNLTQIEKEQYYQSDNKVQLFIDTLIFLRDYLQQLKNIQDPQFTQVVQLFFKQHQQRIKNILSFPQQIADNDISINIQYLEELDAVLSLLNVIYSDNTFFYSSQEIFEKLLQILTNQTILLFENQKLAVQPQNIWEKQQNEIYAFEQTQNFRDQYNPSLFAFKQEALLTQILTKYIFCVNKALQSSQFLHYFNKNSEIHYDSDYWEQFQTSLLFIIQHTKKIGQKWIQNKKKIDQIFLKFQILQPNCNLFQFTDIYLDIEVYDELIQNVIILLYKLFETNCVHIELYNEFKKQINYMSFKDNTILQLENIFFENYFLIFNILYKALILMNVIKYLACLFKTVKEINTMSFRKMMRVHGLCSKFIRASYQIRQKFEILYFMNQQEIKQKGNICYQKQDYEQAITLYTQCINTIENNLDITLFGNRAQSLIKFAESLTNFDQINQIIQLAIQDCDQCISFDKMWIKGYYRKAKCYQILKKYQQAILVLDEAKKLHQNVDQIFIQLYTEIQQTIQSQQQNQKDLDQHKEFMQSLGKYALDNNIMPNFNDLEKFQQNSQNQI